ncbi:hypothetical protein F5148DRAFT_1285032 [Russula earlei]|uniref:Uncharacterized protein n=1 Tax=Russula earlei TaxID=71964 RepID=A0ACC0U7H3_9AGAM|nr:hypothetical protein F5148DRAFT_1285032 [Russula earlei]
MSVYFSSIHVNLGLHETSRFAAAYSVHMSNAPIPPSPGPSRPRPDYGGYQSSHANSFYGNGVSASGKFRDDSWRAQPSYRPRDPHPAHYVPSYDGDRSHFGWHYSHSRGYDTPSDPWLRRDVMAERMFEPSDSWKHDHVHDSGLEISERFAEGRGRMQPPREDYAYTHGSDSYRNGPYIPRRDSAYPRPNVYRPGYVDEGRWNTSYSMDDPSNSWAHQRSPSISQWLTTFPPFFISEALSRHRIAQASFPVFVLNSFLPRAIEISAAISRTFSIVFAIFC